MRGVMYWCATASRVCNASQPCHFLDSRTHPSTLTTHPATATLTLPPTLTHPSPLTTQDGRGPAPPRLRGPRHLQTPGRPRRGRPSGRGGPRVKQSRGPGSAGDGGGGREGRERGEGAQGGARGAARTCQASRAAAIVTWCYPTDADAAHCLHAVRVLLLLPAPPATLTAASAARVATHAHLSVPAMHYPSSVAPHPGPSAPRSSSWTAFCPCWRAFRTTPAQLRPQAMTHLLPTRPWCGGL